jgi:hypothetical protein
MKVSHDPISVQCLFSMTLLPGGRRLCVEVQGWLCGLPGCGAQLSSRRRRRPGRGRGRGDGDIIGGERVEQAAWDVSEVRHEV